jgi:hypothetical protein
MDLCCKGIEFLSFVKARITGPQTDSRYLEMWDRLNEGRLTRRCLEGVHWDLSQQLGHFIVQ